MGRLDGKAALVTGGAQGIGGATARRLAEEGASVLVADIDGEGARRNAARIQAAGGTADSFECDVGTEAGVHSMVERSVSRWGRLDIVVNNAYGVGGMQRAESAEVREADWDRGFDVGLKAMYRSIRFALPYL